MFTYMPQSRRQGVDAEDEKPGGRIQHAITMDLLDFRKAYFEALEPTAVNEVAPTTSDSNSTPFTVFRRLFKEKHIHLLHSLILPGRVDNAAYAQLIYEACLNLLAKSFNCEDEGGNTGPGGVVGFRKYGAFALFSLFVLYESAPLRDNDVTNPYQLLPMTLQAKNPRYVYRRSFHEPIRIDTHHYLLIQRLREESLEQLSICKSGGESELCSRSKCSTCGLAQNVVDIVPRLEWQLAEYIGPVGLEGMAGSSNYRPVHDPKSFSRQTKQLSVDEFKKIKSMTSSSSKQVLPNFNSQLDEYQSHLETLRKEMQTMKGPVHQVNRIRTELGPVLPSITTRTATATSVTSARESQARRHNEDDRSLAASEQKSPSLRTQVIEKGANQLLSFSLPPELSDMARRSLTTALRQYVAEHELDMSGTQDGLIGVAVGGSPQDIKELESSDTHTPPVDEFLWKDAKGEDFLQAQLEDDEVSSVSSTSSMDDDASVTSAVGQAALRSLLRKVGDGSIKRPKIGKHACHNMLEGTTSRKRTRKVEVASKSGNVDDENTVATGIGRRALQLLLSQVYDDQAALDVVKPRAQDANKKPTVAKQMRKPRIGTIKAKRKASGQDHKRRRNDDLDTTLRDEDTVVTGRGREALNLLLSEVKSGRISEDASDSSSPRGRPSGIKAGIKAASVEHQEISCDGESDEDTAKTGRGAKALGLLLSQI